MNETIVLSLAGIGVLALSSVQQENALAAMRYRTEFGVGNLYTLHIATEKEGDRKTGKHRGGQLAFGEEVSFTQMLKMLSDGADIRDTRLTEDSVLTSIIKNSIVPLFAINPRGKLFVYSANNVPAPSAGWKIISLIPQSTEKAAKESAEPAGKGISAGNNLPG